MKSAIVVAASLASLASAFGFGNLHPRATNAVDYILGQGTSPKPTGAVYDIAKALDPDYQTCGYLGGSSQYPLTCSSDSPCGFNDAQSWFGCCSTYTSVSGLVAPVGCSKALTCIPYSQLSSCTGACASNTLVTRCTNSASGFCVTLALSTTQLYTNYICASTSLPVVAIFPSPIAGNGTGGVFSTPGSSSSSAQFTRPSSSSTTTTSSSSTSSSRSSSSSSGNGGGMPTAAPLMVLAGGALVAML